MKIAPADLGEHHNLSKRPSCSEEAGEEVRSDQDAFRLESNADGKGFELPGIAFAPAQISQFETGRREPPLMLLLAYARLAGVSTDVLIDDRMRLPDSFSEIDKS